MLQRIKKICFSLGMLSLIIAPFSFATAAYADGAISNCLSSGSDLNVDTAGTPSGCTPTPDSDTKTSINGILKLVINVFSAIVGFIAVIMIIFAGVKYITSGGESGNISGAKNTIVYAVVGLIIVALAQVLVHFVLAKVNSGVTTGS